MAVPWFIAVMIPDPDFLPPAHVSASSSRRASLAVALGIGGGAGLWGGATVTYGGDAMVPVTAPT